MKNIYLSIAWLLFGFLAFAQNPEISLKSNENGHVLLVENEPFIINGMNWDYFPIGTNFNYSLWKQSDDVIKAALDAEMGLLQNMGVNTIRQYTGVPSKWITYIYDNYGIYTMLNHSFGRYGLNVNGSWVANTEYSDEATRKLLLLEATDMVRSYKDTRGILMFLLGNENNYGLFWDGAETEDIPLEDRKSTQRARSLYKIFNEAVVQMKAIDSNHPMAICNGDLLFIDIIAEECKDIDILGTNMYRGKTFTDAFQTVKEKLNKPLMFTEFGADAFNAIENQEDQKSQAYYMLNNWKDIYKNVAGMGMSGNSIGGFTFQFSDGWWKFGQTKNLDVHDNNASWSNGGYDLDLVPGENNMNEEWFGICAKGPTNPRGLYTLYPRAAYYTLKEVHKLDPYGSNIDLNFVDNYFKNINLMDAVLRARGDKAAMSGGGNSEKIRISNLSAKFTTFSTGGSLITTPEVADPNSDAVPDEQGFDHMQSYFIGIEGNPAANMRAEVNVNILGNVAENPINEIFYENRGRQITVDSQDGAIDLIDQNRVQIYNASYEWNAKDFDARGFYRTGHYHWGYEGDFFGLYPEANYGPNLDIYNGETLGMEVDGKRALKGFKAAFGPQLWWGANPAILLKYSRQVGKYNLTGIYHEDLDNLGGAVSSIAIPQPKTRRVTFHAARKFGDIGLEVGGIWGGSPLNGREFQVAEGTSGNYTVLTDKIQASDNFGGKIKMTYQNGRVNAYAQAGAFGLVASNGGDYTQTFTGWRLKESGGGNQTNVLAGFTYSVGDFQIAPNFLWQKPIVGPMPNDVGAPGRLRNIIQDPFSVRSNRETTAGEILLSYDPTPATWMYEWDNDRSEDAKFAMNIGFVYRKHPTAQDAAIGFSDTRDFLIFPNSAPAEDLWEAHSRVVSKLTPELGLIANMYYGTAQANGSDERLIKRGGGDVRFIYKKVKVTGAVKVNDWGPFDYHRDFNLTYPLQMSLDISTSLGKPDWFILPDTRIGIMGTWRSLNEFSPRYSPNQAEPFADQPIISPIGFPNGSEWEIRTYVHINIGK
ncbi:glycoside hydrolase family 2 TIM barrel-domain containing protein [Nonlabens ulvanivorans]|uniref:glycoside hydrolase family 2 TIM barrel-domain containing protein n=1 Tax=Nonlabens ulvanivorans TaxID=906888 RepID=UPI002943261A|nr:glycoside hydrolase family 2 TIM barrel-domain containing protein [Nonlabens ulvanivorans]WOI21571.1 glycoside hydrolase family 2 TIM barrel-domain containing protein [Nonlabens ulvanivorans]